MSLFAFSAIMIGVGAACVGVLWLARRSPFNQRFSSQLGEHGRAFDFLGVAFAILLGFVVLQSYDSYNDARAGAEEEAQGVLELSRTSAAFSTEEHRRLNGLLICYGRAVIGKGWPAMRHGEPGDESVGSWLRRYRDQAFDIRVDTHIRRAALRQLLMEQDKRTDGRRFRIAEAVREVPPQLWFVLILGAVLTVGWIVLGADRKGSLLVQAAAVASVAAMATAALLLVWFLDHPFSGHSGSIEPIEMEEVLDTIDEELQQEGVHISPPCTENGDPI